MSTTLCRSTSKPINRLFVETTCLDVIFECPLAEMRIAYEQYVTSARLDSKKSLIRALSETTGFRSLLTEPWAAGQKRFFCGVAHAAQSGVAIRKAAVSGNDVPMLRRKICIALERTLVLGRCVFSKAQKTANTFVLQGEVFGVHQRHEQKYAANQRQLFVPPFAERIGYQLLRAAIALKSLSAASKDVAGELVKQDDERKAANGLTFPICQAACHGLGHAAAKS